MLRLQAVFSQVFSHIPRPANRESSDLDRETRSDYFGYEPRRQQVSDLA
jgi:hypothetical protein